MSRLLIIDDDLQLGRSLVRVLEGEGHSCQLQLDPVSAAQTAGAFKPDAVLIELQPEFATTLQQLRDVVDKVPFVFMAGHQGEYTRLGELVRPYDDWVAKPAAPRELIVRLHTSLRRACDASG